MSDDPYGEIHAMQPPRSKTITTPRLVLRPSEADDAPRAFEVQSSWEVTRMLRQASWPPDRGVMDAWFASHPAEWTSGTAFRFAVTLDGHMLGLADIDEISGATGELGYWLDPACWGRGYASEAASALVRFAFDELELAELRAGHAEDNAASGRILRRLGFQHLRDVQMHSRSRGAPVVQRQYALRRPGAQGTDQSRMPPTIQ
jgi:[ribosomal protein S5]-alanine N-acetyltransferase